MARLKKTSGQATLVNAKFEKHFAEKYAELSPDHLTSLYIRAPEAFKAVAPQSVAPKAKPAEKPARKPGARVPEPANRNSPTPVTTEKKKPPEELTEPEALAKPVALDKGKQKASLEAEEKSRAQEAQSFSFSSSDPVAAAADMREVAVFL
jgi:hypothetical protein